MRMFTDAAFAVAIALPSFAADRSAPTRAAALPFMAKVLVVGVAMALIALAVIFWPWTRDSSVDVATKWGLPGIWQNDCAAPLHVNNPRYTYAVEDGKLLLARDFGDDLRHTSAISDVGVTPRGELHYMVHLVQLGVSRNERLSRRNLLVKSPEGRIRVLSNTVGDKGAESVAGGIRLEDHEPTPWMTRCGAA